MVEAMPSLLSLLGKALELNPGPSARQKWEKQRKYYVEHKNEILTKRKDTYKKVQIKQMLPDVLTTVANVRMRELIISHAYSQAQYAKDPAEDPKTKSRFYSQRQYAEDPEAKKAFSARKICCQSRTKKKHLAMSILKEIWYGQKINFSC